MNSTDDTIEELKAILKILDEQIADLSRFDSPMYLTRTVEEHLRIAKETFPQNQIIAQYFNDIEIARSELQRLGGLHNERSRVFQEKFDEWNLRKTERFHEVLITQASLFEKLTVLCAASLGVLVSSLGIISTHIAPGNHLRAKRLLFAGMIALILALLGSLTGHLISLHRSKLANTLGDIHYDEILLQGSTFHYVSPREEREAEKARIKAEFARIMEKKVNPNRLRWLSVFTLGDGTMLAALVIIAIIIAFAAMALFVNANFGM